MRTPSECLITIVTMESMNNCHYKYICFEDIMGTSWGNHGDIMGISWEYHGENFKL